ncbi:MULTISPECIES: hypothetical protein [Actinoplanes]|uniref:hypothetical protein n=1 Tax=Actinoplanes TaxID=1865 RepID=UPI0005F2A8F5|nr:MULTISPECIES: hypothetical protein [Actinoplanes]GLY01993.1 hypothetical protein Acsp01_23720 [Actinoplanes sp. NBRC 101535]
MKSLHDELAGIAGPEILPTPDQVHADLSRGRGALRRRRLAQSAAGSALAVAVAAATFAFTTTGGPSGNGGTLANPPATSAGVSLSSSFELVAYKGEQSAGFSIDKVPAGFEVQGVDETTLTLSPLGAKPRNSADPLGDTPDTDPHSFVGKVMVGLQSVDEKGTPEGGEAVTVNGVAGKIVNKGGEARTLYLPQPNGVNLQVQMWDNIDWSTAQVIEFAEGIHVNENAKQSRG